VNFSASEVTQDLNDAMNFIKARNRNARFIITVSPVPLIATAEPRSVLVSTALSKAVLRVAAEMATAGRRDAAYFPSYEIITGAHARGQYFEPDLRSVTEAGVAHVMKLFLRHYTDIEIAGPALEQRQQPDPSLVHLEQMRKGAALICEEELLDQPAAE
jgi:hypothetical protein